MKLYFLLLKRAVRWDGDKPRDSFSVDSGHIFEVLDNFIRVSHKDRSSDLLVPFETVSHAEVSRASMDVKTKPKPPSPKKTEGRSGKAKAPAKKPRRRKAPVRSAKKGSSGPKQE